MVPDARKRVVDRGVVKKIVSTHRTVVSRTADGHPVNGEGNPVLAGCVGIQTSVVLLLRDLGRVQGGVFTNIRDPIETGTNAGISAALIGEILRVQARLERRANVEALTCEGGAIGALHQADVGAGGAYL